MNSATLLASLSIALLTMMSCAREKTRAIVSEHCYRL